MTINKQFQLKLKNNFPNKNGQGRLRVVGDRQIRLETVSDGWARLGMIGGVWMTLTIEKSLYIKFGICFQ
jgi:hypothetical protein